MSQTCARCSRINPKEAVYCYYDGSFLAATAGAAPVKPGQQPFPSPFVFPNGQSCQNFDQLALTCQQNWNQSLDILQQGLLEQFLGGLGRVDLAQSAKAAAGYPDKNRGLDQFLAKLPTDTLQAPRVQVEPKQISLGVVQIGTDQTHELTITNVGGRLLYGSVVTDNQWVAIGDKSGHSQKLFECIDSCRMPIQIRGAHLRAGNKPLDCKLMVDTNGGRVMVLIRAQVPVTPFPAGPLSGAKSPRELAVKAKLAPIEAAPLFHQGAVKKWYEANGWTYPVRGEAATGVAAVQQFFEALGLVKAPRVEISDKSVSVAGAPGQQFEQNIFITTKEKRHVYAHAVGDQQWINASAARIKNTQAKVRIQITLPANAAGALRGTVYVAANGNQRFEIPVQATVSGNLTSSAAAVAAPLNIATPAVAGVDGLAPPAMIDPAAGAYAAPQIKRRRGVSFLVHLIPLVLLGFVLFIVFARDILAMVWPGGGNGPTKVMIEGGEQGGKNLNDIPIDPNQRLYYRYGRNKRFGMMVAQTGKRITFSPNGGTNTTVVRFNNTFTRDFGDSRFGRWVLTENAPPLPVAGQMPKTTRSKNVWRETSNQIEITQVVEIIPGQQPVEVEPKKMRRLLDTCLVAWQIENKDTRPHAVGLRMQLDTLIGRNDGVPFTVPGLPGLERNMRDFRAGDPKFPDFIQALEVPNLQNPGTVALLTLKTGGGLESPDRVSLTHWPGTTLAWNIRMTPIGRDSCVVMYWNDKTLKPGEKRYIGFAYGLGSVTADKNSNLGLIVQGDFDPGKSFVVTALVDNPLIGQTVTLKLPPGLKLRSGAKTQPVPPGGVQRRTVVTWRVQVERTGRFPLDVTSSTGAEQRRTITIARSDPASGRTNPKNIFR